MDNYNIDSIESLSFKDGVRLRIPMYLGTDDTEGIYQALKEVINNSTDEALMGFGDTIEIHVDEKQNAVAVIDKGRGIPFGTRENGENVLVSVFSKPHTGGKFNNKSYTTSSGLNGIGIKATCLSSEKFEAEVRRDGKVASVYFEKGELKNYREGRCKPDEHGTYIRFKPDKEVFKNMDEGFSYKRICEETKTISYLNKKIHFIVKNDDTDEEKDFYSENGIADFISDIVKKPLMKAPIIVTKSDQTDEVEVAFMWTGEESQSYVFVNGLICVEGGSPITGAKTTITTSMKRLSGKDFNPELIRKGLVFAINCKVANPSFSNQTKSKINNGNLRTLASAAFKEGLETFSNTPDFKAIVDMMTKYQKAELAAEKARTAILEHNKEMTSLNKKKLEFISKLHDAEELGEKATLYIAEGNSAAVALLSGRRTEIEGVMEVKGKMLNTFKAKEDKIIKNEEIKLLLYAMGQTLYNFNEKKLRYGRIAIASDQDADGFSIALLILTVLRTICPEIISQNRVYRLYSPLYIEHDKRGNPINWWYTDDDYNKDRDKIKGSISRIKGWGSLSDEDLAVTIFSDRGKLDRIVSSPEGIQTLEDLMGPDITKRKEFIFNNIDFSKYGEII